MNLLVNKQGNKASLYFYPSNNYDKPKNPIDHCLTMPKNLKLHLNKKDPKRLMRFFFMIGLVEST